MSLLRTASVRYLGGHRLQLALSVLGIALGVAVVVSIDLAIQSAREGFRISAEAVSGRATHHIVSEAGTLDEALFVRLRTELGVRAAAPVVEGVGASPALPGRALRVVGIDPFSEGPFRPYVAGGSAGLDVARFLTLPGAAVLAAETARSGGFAPGGALPMEIEGRRAELTLLATLDPSDRLVRLGLADVVLVDLSTAQMLFGMQGRLSRIDLLLPDGAEGDAAVERITAALPTGARVEAAGTRTETMSGMIAAFDLNLTALSLLALTFGMFLIYNTMTFSVVHRRPVLGRLRALGVTRAEILRLVLREAGWIGSIGAVLGIGLGIVLAQGLVRLVARTINDLYFSVSVERLSLEPLLLAKGVALGVGATLLAALAPALEAASAPPRVTMLRSSGEAAARASVPRAAGAGAVLLLLAGGLLALPSEGLLTGFGALFLAILGMALLTPAGTVLLARAVRPLLARAAGVLGAIASRGIVTALSRTAPAVAALVVAVSVTVGLGVMIQSFRGTLVRWLDGTLVADVYVSLPGPQASRAAGTLWPELVAAYVQRPEVVGHSTYRGVEILTSERAFRLVALELDAKGEAAFDFVAGDPDRAMQAFQAGEGVLVSEPYANRYGSALGDPVELSGDLGTARLPVVGIFYDYGSEQGTVMVARSRYDTLFDDMGITSLALYLAPEVEAEGFVEELRALVPPGRTVVARTNRALREASLEVFDRTFRVTVVLRMLAFVVAFVGVLSALMALELERSGEFGVLRATGLTPGQLRGVVMTQTGLLGLFSGLMALPVGTVLSAIMIFVINKRAFGWTLQMELDPMVFVQALTLAVVGALAAGLYPAWRMARTSPAVALRGA